VSDLSLADMRRAGPRQPLRPAIRLTADGARFRFDPALAGDLLYHDCDDAVAWSAVARLCAEPVAPQETALRLRVAPRPPRHYVICSEDRAIPPEYQARMASVLPADAVTTLATGHSPFFAAPELLADRLVQILQSIRRSGPSNPRT
jgi:pimeloyl-ACP methyl ester carboxylesterase